MRFILLLTIVLTLTACAPTTVWYRPGTSNADTWKDFGKSCVFAQGKWNPRDASASWMLAEGYRKVRPDSVPGGSDLPH